MEMNSPIEYFGGKTYMVDMIQNFFPQSYRLYVEGFGGGASLLLNKKIDELEIYNDLNRNVYSLFKVISDSELLKQLQDKMYLTYYSSDLRKEYLDKLDDDNLSLFDRAYYFLYVNRTSFNGCGGFSFNPIIRRSMSKSISGYLSCIDSLPAIHERIFHTVIENRDIFDLIDKYDAKDTFFYLDPPYIQSTRKSSQKYDCDFTDEQHRQFVDRILQIKGFALVSGYDHEIYNRLVENGWNKYQFSSPNSSNFVVETLWYNYDVASKNDLW